jgi:hypothetical protein
MADKSSLRKQTGTKDQALHCIVEHRSKEVTIDQTILQSHSRISRTNHVSRLLASRRNVGGCTIHLLIFTLAGEYQEPRVAMYGRYERRAMENIQAIKCWDIEYH